MNPFSLPNLLCYMFEEKLRNYSCITKAYWQLKNKDSDFLVEMSRSENEMIEINRKSLIVQLVISKFV
ncbi:hypothetical protein T11_10413 [Trichinella zimbabwensis]|uniref:Uncharacterized protein n=1 Tax=Trichinella zimbabwensis TaxID=268475 RepID=A0A0V1HYN6_9BILA|nr:hypothetical protein T11_10413 [Trichinella zimbabwensis]